MSALEQSRLLANSKPPDHSLPQEWHRDNTSSSAPDV